jgi:hypothetical protein
VTTLSPLRLLRPVSQPTVFFITVSMAALPRTASGLPPKAA